MPFRQAVKTGHDWVEPMPNIKPKQGFLPNLPQFRATRWEMKLWKEQGCVMLAMQPRNWHETLTYCDAMQCMIRAVQSLGRQGSRRSQYMDRLDFQYIFQHEKGSVKSLGACEGVLPDASHAVPAWIRQKVETAALTKGLGCFGSSLHHCLW